MPSVVADTHAAVWYLLKSPRLSRAALGQMEEGVARGDAILLPAICLVEIVYLVEKGRIPAADGERLFEALASEDSALQLVPLDRSIARAVARVPRDRVPDMPDRIIAATALHLGLPLVSRDRRISAPGLEVIW